MFARQLITSEQPFKLLVISDDCERFSVQVVPKMSYCPHDSESLSLVARIIALCLVITLAGICYDVLVLVAVTQA